MERAKIEKKKKKKKLKEEKKQAKKKEKEVCSNPVLDCSSSLMK